MSTKIEKLSFGKMEDGREASLFRFKNASGAVAELTNYGGRIVRFLIPNKKGERISTIKGYDDVKGYEADTEYLGSTVGRFANRIAKGKFFAEGEEYTLKINNAPNSLHGGPTGFARQLWDARVEGESVILSYTAADMEEGFPGTFNLEVVYTWSDDCEFNMNITAKCDQRTPVNITNHAYFNLAGQGDILDHEVQIFADRFIPILPDAIPTGEILLVKGSAFDFSSPKKIGKDLENDEEQLKNGCGYDHCFVLNKKEFGECSQASEVFSETSGVGLKVFTTMPGMQFYSGNYLNSTVNGHEGYKYEKRQAFCMEPEFFPDSPNQSGFPCAMLNPGEIFEHTMRFQFFTK